MPPAQERPELAPIPPERLQAVADWLQANVRPVAHVIESETGEARTEMKPFERRDYQLEAWVKLDDAQDRGETRVLGNLAPALGKTFVAAVHARRYLEKCAVTEPGVRQRILYVSHMNEINDQAAETFQEVMPDAKIAFFKTGRSELPDADITFATIQSLYSELERFDPEMFQLIDWDEGHHLEAETFKKVRDHFRPRFEHALTGTVERMDGKDITEYFGRPLYKKSLAEGIAEGWLADVDYHIVFDRAIKAALRDGFEPKTLQDIKDLFKNKPSSEDLAQSILDEIAQLGLVNPKIGIFCESIAEADEMALLLDGAAYHSGVRDPKQVMQDFRTGRNRVIATRDKFNEGVNIPDMDVAVFLRALGSPGMFDQQLGRGLRKTEAKTKLTVLDYVANIERIAKIRELSEDIQRRSREIGQQGVTEEGVIFEREGEHSGRGLRIHTVHGDFDFDTLAVDLLEKYGILRQRWRSGDPAEMVQRARELKSDGPLTCPQIAVLSKSGEFVNPSTIYEHFGSMRAFQRACGYEKPERLDLTMDNDDLVDLAREFSPNGPLRRREMQRLSSLGEFVNPSTIKERFGSIGEFHEACGFETIDRKPRFNDMTNDDLVELALELNSDEPLGQGDIAALSRSKQFVSVPTVRKRFGSVPEFHKACGFETLDVRSLTREGLVELALKLKSTGPLTSPEISALSKAKKFPNLSVIYDRFDNLSDFQRACGFDV